MKLESICRGMHDNPKETVVDIEIIAETAEEEEIINRAATMVMVQDIQSMGKMSLSSACHLVAKRALSISFYKRTV